MTKHLQIKNLVIGYGIESQSAPINLEVVAGKTLAILGPSGCGKSTLLNTLVGGQPAIDGEIWLGDTVINGWPIEKRRIAIMYQEPMLFPHLTVAENVAFGMNDKDATGITREQKVAEYLELVKLSGFANRAVQTLSGGQAQRVALARTLAAEPNVLLLDEPLSALDSELRKELAGELRRILHERGLTTIFVTHDRMEAELIADEVIDWHWNWQ